MRVKTSIGSSPTGRCNGLDKVPWRDLTLLDKLDIQPWGSSSSHGGARCHDQWKMGTPLFFSFSSRLSRIPRGP